MEFSNLIVYSDYSVHIGYGTIDEYISVCKQKGIKTLSLTDTNSMMGIFKFLTKCKANDIKAIVGVTLTVEKHNITFLAKNINGYHELCKLLTQSTRNNLDEPFLTTTDIKQTDNIVAIVHTYEKEPTEQFLSEFKNKVKDVYLEFTLLKGNRRNISQSVTRLSERTNTPLVLTNPTFYAYDTDFEMSEINMALIKNYSLQETPVTRGGLRPALFCNEHYLKSTQELVNYVKGNVTDVPKQILNQAIINNQSIVDMIEQVELEYQLGLRPVPHIPAPFQDSLSYFKALIQEGWDKIVADKPKEVQAEWKKRIKNELEVIHSNDFIDYFLVVREYIKWSEDNGYPTGCGRGSAGGSCIARLLGIHKTDPVRYDLMFDRFLSPGRSAIARITYDDNSFEEIPVSTVKNINNKDDYTYTIKLGDTVDGKTVTDYKIIDIGAAPDVDTDFEPEVRPLVFKHCQEEYGENNITHIITRMPYGARNAFRCVARVYGIPPQEVNSFSELLPEAVSKDTLKDVLDEKNETYESARLKLNPLLLEIIKRASELEGRTSGTGVHACGVLISCKEISDTVPTIYKEDPRDKSIVYQVSMFEYPEAESLGLIKMDFLGLDTLHLISSTVKLVEQYTGKHIDMSKIIDGTLDDKKTYQMFQKAKTSGIFQFAEQGVRTMLTKVKPSEFEELPAITAIYRPGPMSLGLHDDFAVRKNDPSKRIPFSREFIGTPIDTLTKDTLGAIIYQEQVMKIAQEAAGFTSKEADKMRKAMGKKKIEILNMLEPKFKKGIIENTKCSESTVNEFWAQLLGFAQYGFNKSHAVSYALNSYQSAYLKVHYPVLWETAALRMYADNPDKVAKYIEDARSNGIEILPPNINESDLLISPTSDLKNIVYSISNIKKVPTSILEAFILERERNGKYTDLMNFINRNKDIVSKSVLEVLACSGCLDCFGNTRKSIYDNAEKLVKSVQRKKNNVASLFAMVGEEAISMVELDDEEWPILEKMANEGQALGAYLSGNPLDGLKTQDGQDIVQTKDLKECDSTQYITFLSVAQKKTRSGKTLITGIANNGVSQAEIKLPTMVTNRILLGTAMEKTNGDRQEAYKLLRLTDDKKKSFFDALEPLDKPEKFNTIYKLTYTKGFRGSMMISDIEPVEVSKNNQILERIVVDKNKTKNLPAFQKLVNKETEQAKMSGGKLIDILVEFYSVKDDMWKTVEIDQIYVSAAALRLIK
jgi:DNA polymerase III, alpha subunit